MIKYFLPIIIISISNVVYADTIFDTGDAFDSFQFGVNNTSSWVGQEFTVSTEFTATSFEIHAQQGGSYDASNLYDVVITTDRTNTGYDVVCGNENFDTTGWLNNSNGWISTSCSYTFSPGTYYLRAVPLSGSGTQLLWSHINPANFTDSQMIDATIDYPTYDLAFRIYGSTGGPPPENTATSTEEFLLNITNTSISHAILFGILIGLFSILLAKRSP